MQAPFFLEEVGAEGVARITLTRTDVHNAFNEQFIAELTSSLIGLESDKRVRAIVLAAQGPSFSAGADLTWMQQTANYGAEENFRDAKALARLMRTLYELSKPTLALVQGAAYGGGVGLVACCDIALAAQSVHFALSEVRLGLIPAVISPYVVAAMGERAARRYFLTGERFSAETAAALGLVHEAVPDPRLESKGELIVAALLKGGPQAQTASKSLIAAVRNRPLTEKLVTDTARRIASQRCGAEGREGISAFLEKRKPSW